MDDRKGYKKEIVLGWINKTKSLNIFTIGDFEDVNGGDNKKGDEVLNSFIRSLARPLGDVMDLDPSKNSEYRTIEK